MPIEETDQTYMHIEYTDSTHFTCTFMKRREVAPFDFVPRVIQSCAFIDGDWIILSTEYLNDE